MIIRLRLYSALALSVALVGCGGGGGGSSSGGGGGGGERHLGPVSIQMSGNPTTQIAETFGGVNVVGMAGAAFSKVQVNLPPLTQANVEQVRRATMIAYTNNFFVPLIYSYATGQSYRLIPAESNFRTVALAFFPKGNKIALLGYGPSSGGVATVNVDGTGFKQIVSGISINYGISVSPDGTKIVFGNYAPSGYYGLMKVNADGSALTQLTPGAATQADNYPSWVTNNQIAFVRWSNGYTGRIYSIDAAGGSLTDLTGYDLGLFSLAVSPSATQKATFTLNGSGTWDLVTMPYTNGTSMFYDNLGIAAVSQMSWSPDGNAVVYGATNSGTFDTYLTDLGVSQDRLLLPNALAAKWGPYITQWLFVGTNGILMPSSAGFLFSESGPNIDSLIAFDAATRSTAKVKNLDSGSGAGSMVYDVTADSLKSFKYANSLTGRPVVVIDPAKATTYAKGAIVSFDPATGLVASVVTHDALGAPPSAGGGGLRLEGSFREIWNAKGEVKSLQGVKELRLNPATGVLAP